MENFHSTQNLLIDRHSSYGTRMVVNKVKNATTKKGNFAVVVSSDVDFPKGDAFRKFFELLDKGELKNKQGGVLRCDKKTLYYFDNTESFPKGITINPLLSKNGVVCFKFKTASYIDGVNSEGGVFYRSASFDPKIFPAELKTPAEQAKYIKEHLDTIYTKDGKRIVEYLPSMFEKIPDIKVPCGIKYPKNIQIKSVSSDKKEVKVSVWCSNDLNAHNVIFNLEKVPDNLYKPVYAFYVADKIYYSGIKTLDEGMIRFDRFNGEYAFVSNKISESINTPNTTEVKISEEDSVIVDPNDERAIALIGKRVFASHSFNMNRKFLGILQKINPDSDKPFIVDGNEVFTIKKAPEPKLECYDFRDKEVRKSIFGKIFVSNNGDCEEIVCSFKVINDRWVINGKITAYDLMNNYTWSDGSPCGQVVDIATPITEE